ncbi:hypothetical protein NC652_036436 [Populus alba x Populus x berolinensis]|nr:hypothetical protein NC652_036436 [Populus alba x Populus x berolinensis]
MIVPRHRSASQATRALSCSCSPVQQAINYASSTPRKKAVLADFVTPSSGDTTAVEKQHPYYVGPPADPYES